jgi:hypothetical protein
MQFAFLGLWLLAFSAVAAGPVKLTNDREGKSFYSSSSDKRAVARALKQIDSTQMIGAFDDVLRDADENKICSFDINFELEKKLKKVNKKFDEMEGAILYLRSQNEFDDTVTKILLTANKVTTTDITLPKEELDYPDKKVIAPSLELIKGFLKKSKGQCFDDAFKTLFTDILKNDKEMTSENVEALLYMAKTKKIISTDLYLKLEQSRDNELEKFGLSLKAYLKKIKSLRLQYPLRDATEKSDFVTEKIDSTTFTRRQRLLEAYTDLQIVMMANIIKKLRTRIEAKKVEILIYDRSNSIETITLEPMERFRLAIKLLRKEMSLLALNTYFNGRSPDYIDLMTASYEVGIIPASELDEVSGLQDVWNPQKTFWEKAEIWVRTLSSVATIAIPPPYGFLPALGIVVIEMTVDTNDKNKDDPTVLF